MAKPQLDIWVRNLDPVLRAAMVEVVHERKKEDRQYSLNTLAKAMLKRGMDKATRAEFKRLGGE